MASNYEAAGRVFLPMNLSIVVPVYKGEMLIEPLVAQLSKTLPTFSQRYEIILVNDGSPDNSWSVIQSLTNQYEYVRGICMMRNYGQHNATLCGIRLARYDVTVTMDQDLQPSPEDIPLLLDELETGCDVD